MGLLISEELLLLGLDHRKGGTSWSEVWAPLSVGVIVDAIAAGTVTVSEDRLHPGDEPEHPLLRRVRAAVVDEGEARSLLHWVSRLPKVLAPLAPTVGARLVERGVLREEPGRVLLFWSTTRLPEADPGPERALRARLRAVLVDGSAPSAHDTQLVALLHHDPGRIDAVLSDEDRQVRKAARGARRRDHRAGGRPAGCPRRDDAAEAAAQASAVNAAVMLMTSAAVVGTLAGGVDGGVPS